MIIGHYLIGGMLGRTLTKDQRKKGLVLLLAYIAALELAILVYTAPAVLTFAPGIAVAGLLLGGIALWPIIFVATLAVYIFNGYPVFLALSFGLAHTIQPVFATYILKKFRFEPTMSRLEDMLSLMGVAFSVSVITPTVAYTALFLSRYFFGGRLPGVTWGSWWIGITMSILIVTPFIVSWAADHRRLFENKRKLAEAICSVAMVAVISLAISWFSISQLFGISLVYFLLIPLMWIALRLGARITTFAILLTAVITFAGVFLGNDMPSPERLGRSLFQTSLLIEIITALFFIIAGVDEERKSNMRQLKFHVKQLEDAVGMRDEFISIASHELKTPVTSLKIYSQMMQKEFESKHDDTLLKHAHKMNGQLDKLVSLVEDLLNVSRSRLGRLEFHKEEFDLETLVRETAEDIQSHSPSHAIRVAGSLPRTVWGDKDRIAQVIVNLMNNAIKYSPQAQVVLVTLSDAAGRARVAVRDYGIGIGEEHHDKIFGLFYRVSESGGNTFPGFGIGLHISREIIERHDGEIGVESVKGEGAEFSFSIPYAADMPEDSAEAAPGAEPA